MYSVKHTLILILLLTGLAACGPEADRTRGGGPGADPGNRHLGAPTLRIHGETDPSYQTPLRGQAIEQIRQAQQETAQ